ncbi:MAG: glutamine amidotransferase, partial [Planctomycetota bacterium]
TGEHEVNSVPTWDFYRMGPGEFEQVLAEFDVLIFSDVESKNFQLAPQFFDRSKFGIEPLTFPDRVRLTVEAIRGGTHAMFLGGWLSFNGEMGKGGWGRTGLKEILPVTCLDVEDLRESTEGFTGQSIINDHPAIQGIDLNRIPPILGYNVVSAREDCQVIANWKETGDPLMAVGQFDSGRVLAYTSDPAPHWGCNFVYWQEYKRFWIQSLRWLLNE